MIIPFSLALTRLHLEHNAWFLVLQYKKHVESSMGALQKPGNKKGERLREPGCFFLEKRWLRGHPGSPPQCPEKFYRKGQAKFFEMHGWRTRGTKHKCKWEVPTRDRGLLCTVKISITKLRAAWSEFSICCGSSRRLDS